MNLSEHFTLEEAVFSSTARRRGLDNTPGEHTIEIMKSTATELEKVRRILGNQPLHIDSWYRSPEVNQAVGSKLTSQHILGQAVDFVAPSYGDPLAVCKKLIEEIDLIQFDQLILEHTWVHISFAIPNTAPRHQVLSSLAGGKYAIGLTNRLGACYEY